jgi:hypothetical protein
VNQVQLHQEVWEVLTYGWYTGTPHVGFTMHFLFHLLLGELLKSSHIQVSNAWVQTTFMLISIYYLRTKKFLWFWQMQIPSAFRFSVEIHFNKDWFFISIGFFVLTGLRCVTKSKQWNDLTKSPRRKRNGLTKPNQKRNNCNKKL